MPSGIYLDNNMAAQPSEKAVAAMIPFLMTSWGNPSAPHQMGQELFLPIQEAMKAIYALLGSSEEDNVIFTASGAEAVNHAVFSTYLDVSRTTGKNHFITALTDEAPTIMSLNRLEQLGCTAKLISPNSKGIITADIVADAITPRTALVSLSWANGLTGTVNDVASISKLCAERGIRLHLDATHILGKLFYQLDEINPHFISFNGSQFHAPQGSGGLFIRNNMKCSPFISGGLEQGGFRAGCINVPALIATGVAAQEALETRDLLCTETARLRDKLEAGIVSVFPDAVIFFRDTERLPNITSIAFPGILNEAMLFALNKKNIFASIGGGSFQQIGLILSASEVPTVLASSALSFSLSRATSEEEIDRAIFIIGETSNRLIKVSKELIIPE